MTKKIKKNLTCSEKYISDTICNPSRHNLSNLMTRSVSSPTPLLPPLPGLSGGFDSGANTTETSVMNFLSAMESRALQQAGPVGASLLPPFRTTTWQTGEATHTLYTHQMAAVLHTHF